MSSTGRPATSNQPSKGRPIGWGGLLSGLALVAAVALAYRFQEPLLDLTSGKTQTFCYRGVRTHDDEQPNAQCFEVSGGRFTKVWTADKDASQDDSPLPTDAYVIPGLWDGHGHLLQYGEFLHSVDLFGAKTLDEVRDRLADYVSRNPGAGSSTQWIRGIGWDQTSFGRMPAAADIEQDQRLKGLFMMLDRIDVHCSWVSQPVLNLLPPEVPDIPGGEVVRDPGMGVFCDNAMDMVMTLWPQPDRETKAAMVKSAMETLNSFGIVGMHDAGATPGTLRMYEDMAGSEDWTLRVYSMLECDRRNAFCPNDAVKVDREDGLFAVRSVKLFADGALGSWGSAMIEPYTDHPWTSGSLLINATDLTRVTHEWASAGYQVNIHAIGDLANRYAIDAFAAALTDLCGDTPHKACQETTHRFRIEHSQIIHPEDQERMHALGVIPSIQPTHATSDMKYAEARLGTDRLSSSAYRMRSLLPLSPVLGSDFPVEPADPFQGLYAAVARKSPHTGKGVDEAPGEGWYAEESLGLEEALRGFTLGPARGAFLEDKAGVIKEGAFADWVVLDRPVEDMDIDELRSVRVRETWVAGKRVYKGED